MLTVITGSASGIGAAVRKRLEKSGDKVIGVDLRNAEVIANLATKEGRNAAIAEVKIKCGDHIDRFVAAAGVSSDVRDMSMIMAVDYFGVVDLLDGLFDLLRRGNNPAAVVISSIGFHKLPTDQYSLAFALLHNNEEEANRIANGLNEFIGFQGPYPRPREGIVYNAAKYALVYAARQRALLWGNAGVRLNVVAPGMTLTPMLQRSLDDPKTGDIVKAYPIPLKRFAQPEEQAAVIAFLLSNEASYVHGAVVFNDGGVDPMECLDRF